MFTLILLLVSFYQGTIGQELYVGKQLGEFSSYHHQVSGDVYAVNENKFLIKKFTYDGNGKDTFFWAGSKPRPGPQGFLVPNEYGRTNVLERYLNEDITITLPDDKKISDIKWLSVYDLSRLESFADVYIMPGFEPPQKVILPRFKSRIERVSSSDVIVLDSKTLLLKDFYFDGKGEAYFFVGLGPQPHARGKKIPDEHGYMTPLRKYTEVDVRLVLPGKMDVFNTDWLAVYDSSAKQILGHIIISDELNVPPSLITVTSHESPLPNCEQLHRDLQISWEIFGNVITIEVTANMEQDDYAAFGISGSESHPKMVDGDAMCVFRDTYNGYIYDLDMSSHFPCATVAGKKKGVCEDLAIKAQDNNQLMSSTRIDGIASFTYRRPLVTPDTKDKPIPTKTPAMIIWALGPLDQISKRPQPAMHYAWSKFSQPISFSRAPDKNCFAFTKSSAPPPKSWKPVHLTHPARNLTFQLGPDGGPRGYSAITNQVSVTGLSWYVDGYLIPELYLRRYKTYSFYIYGGANPYDPSRYHPLIITDEPRGAFSQLSDEEQKNVRIFTGVEQSLRGGILRPKSGGFLCLWEHPSSVDRRRDIDMATFVDFRNSLKLNCDSGDIDPHVLHFTPNRSWPDLLYYNSWTGANMGWKIHILDSEEQATNTARPTRLMAHFFFILTFVCFM